MIIMTSTKDAMPDSRSAFIRIGLGLILLVVLPALPVVAQEAIDQHYYQGFEAPDFDPPGNWGNWYGVSAWGRNTGTKRTDTSSVSASIDNTTDFGKIIGFNAGFDLIDTWVGNSVVDTISLWYRLSSTDTEDRFMRVITGQPGDFWASADDQVANPFDDLDWFPLTDWFSINTAAWTQCIMSGIDTFTIFNEEPDIWIAIQVKGSAPNIGTKTVYIDDFEIKLALKIPVVPNAPIPLSPATGHETQTPTPLFSWSHNDTDNAAQFQYQLQISDSTTFSTIIVDDSSASERSDTTIELPINLPYPADSIWYWRVRTSNTEDSYSAWSSGDSWFRVRLNPPDSPTLLQPVADHETTVRTIRFQWIHNDPETSPQQLAQIELSRDPAFTASWFLYVGGTSDTTDTTFAPEEDTIYWRARTADALDSGPWSDSRILYLVFSNIPVVDSVLISNDTPARLVAPTLFDTGLGGDTVWFGPVAQICTAVVAVTSRNFDSIAVSAGFDSPARVAPAPSPVSIVFHITAAHAFLGETTILLEAWDRTGNMDTTRILFRPDTAAPETVALLAPSDSAFVGSTPTCSWTVAGDTGGIGLSRYILQVAPTAGFTSILYQETTVLTSTTIGTPLADSIYFWRLLAVDRVENIETTTAVIRSFTIDSTAPMPATLITPADAYETSRVPIRFEWTASTDSLAGVAWQRIEIARDSSFASIDTTLTLGTLDTTASACDTFTGSDTFWWRIVSRDSAGNETTSLKRSFILDTTPPLPAALSSPANGYDTPTTTVRLAWTAASDTHTGVASYRLQLDTGSFFTTPRIDSTAALQTETTLVLPANDTWYWRIIVSDRVGNVDTGAARLFRIDTAPPSRPALLAPIGGETRLAPVGFQWSASTDSISGLDTYRLQAATDSIFTLLTLNQSLDSTVTADTRALDTGIWFWRIVAIDRLGNTETSLVDSVTVEAPPDTTPPTVFSLTAPANNLETNSISLLYAWQTAIDSSAPVTYRLTILDAVGALAYETTILDTFITRTLPANDSYHWSVTALDPYGNDRLSTETFTLKIDTAPPTAFSLSSPGNTLETNAVSHSFAWQTAVDSSTTIRYTLTVLDSVGALEYETTILETSTLLTLPANDSYRWSVTAVDSSGNARLSTETFSVRIDTAPPASFSLLSPTNGFETTGTAILFSWQSTTDSLSIRYTLTILDSAGALEYETTVVETSVLRLLEVNDSYRWSVTATDSVGNARLSTETFSVIVDTSPPSTPTLLSPTAAADTISPVTFRWSTSTDSFTGIDSYRIQISASQNMSDSIVADSALVTTDTSLVLEIRTWYWRVLVSDRLGNTATTESSSFAVLIASESIPPVILTASATPATRTNTGTETTRLLITAVDSSRIDTVVADLSILGAHYSAAAILDTTADSTQWRLDVTIDTRVLEDTHAVRVRVTDQYGNSTETWVRFFVSDVSPPFAAISSLPPPPNGETTVSISGNALTLAVETSALPTVDAIHFEYRASGETTWTEAPAVSTSGTSNPATNGPPWTFVWALPETAGYYEIRSVGITSGGESDPSPTFTRLNRLSSGGLINEYWGADTQLKDLLLRKTTAETFYIGGEPVLRTSGSSLTSFDTLQIRITRYDTAQAAAPAPTGRADGSGLKVIPGDQLFHRIEILTAGRKLDAAVTLSIALGGITADSRSALSWYRYDTTQARWTRKPGAITVPDPAQDTVILSVALTSFSDWAPLLQLAEASLAGVIVYPNPFIPYDNNTRTGIPFVSGVDGSGVIFDRLTNEVTIEIYTISGVRVATIRTGNSTGRIHWNAQNDDRMELASGIYLCIIKAPTGERITRKLMIIR